MGFRCMGRCGLLLAALLATKSMAAAEELRAQMFRIDARGTAGTAGEVLLADSPDGVRLLVELRESQSLTVLVISHDFVGLEDLCPRVLHLGNGVLASSGDA